MFQEFWNDKRVLITGHTGFKGSWLSIWLKKLGAKVYGYSLEPNTKHGVYSIVNNRNILDGEAIADIRDYAKIYQFIVDNEIEVVFHLAAQPLVKAGYAFPLDTFSVNVMGLLQVLEATKMSGCVKAVINVTSDKCYKNVGWEWPYREIDELGGDDPYSASKACAEIVTECFRKSFLSPQNIAIASARAGNVIGGGDWAEDRLVPDFIRSYTNKKPFIIRNPKATRPWQHVIEPLAGYLMLGEKLLSMPDVYSTAWNFGPENKSVKTVAEISNLMVDIFDAGEWIHQKQDNLSEAQKLSLDSSKSKNLLPWKPIWDVEKAMELTLEWYNGYMKNENLEDITIKQLELYEEEYSNS